MGLQRGSWPFRLLCVASMLLVFVIPVVVVSLEQRESPFRIAFFSPFQNERIHYSHMQQSGVRVMEHGYKGFYLIAFTGTDIAEDIRRLHHNGALAVLPASLGLGCNMADIDGLVVERIR